MTPSSRARDDAYPEMRRGRERALELSTDIRRCRAGRRRRYADRMGTRALARTDAFRNGWLAQPTVQPKTAFSHFRRVRRADFEVQLRVQARTSRGRLSGRRPSSIYPRRTGLKFQPFARHTPKPASGPVFVPRHWRCRMAASSRLLWGPSCSVLGLRKRPLLPRPMRRSLKSPQCRPAGPWSSEPSAGPSPQSFSRQKRGSGKLCVPVRRASRRGRD